MEPLDKGKKKKKSNPITSNRKAERDFKKNNASTTFDFDYNYNPTLSNKVKTVQFKTDTTGMASDVRGIGKYPYQATRPSGRVDYGYASKNQVQNVQKKIEKNKNVAVPNLPNYKKKP